MLSSVLGCYTVSFFVFRFSCGRPSVCANVVPGVLVVACVDRFTGLVSGQFLPCDSFDLGNYYLLSFNYFLFILRRFLAILVMSVCYLDIPFCGMVVAMW